ncbi:YdeI family protein [Parasediminibacterium paludis]|uniref:YdeI family protein n=1 Tax=Parasediminibacterium paludis TaxID=908966 RepID=A0ABV8PUY8_9BACT
MVKTENFEQIEITTANELRDWLAQNHAQKESIWVITHKKELKEKYVSKQDILDELLCFGWIDGIGRKLDESRTMLLISQRRAQHWSKSYKDRFAKLEKQGRITEAGRQAVLVSKEKGLWNFMDDVDALIKPQDFIESLEQLYPAMNNFDAIGASSKRFMLRYIKIAKTAETRAQRIAEITILAKEGRKLKGS